MNLNFSAFPDASQKVPDHLLAPPLPKDHHRQHKHYDEDRRMILALFGVDGDRVPYEVFYPIYEKLALELGLDAESIRDREAVFVEFGTTELSREQKRALGDDVLHDIGLEPATELRRARALLDKSLTDPAVERYEARLAGHPPLVLGSDPDWPENERNEECVATQVDHSNREMLYLEALAMFRRGKRQKEIAAHFGKTDRTIRTWLDEARKLQVAALNELTPAHVVADDHEMCITMMANLRERLETAWANGNSRLALDLVRELRAWSQHHRELLASIQLTGRYEHPEVRRSRQLAALESAVSGI